MSVFDRRDLVEAPRRIWIAKSQLDPTAPDPPANTQGTFGAAWPAGFRCPGYTARDAMVFGGLSAERTAIYSGEQRGQIASAQGEIAETVAFRLLSRTLQNIRDMAARGVFTITPAGSGTPGEHRLVWSDTQSEEMALGIEAYGVQGRLWRAYYPVGTFAITDGLQQGLGSDVMAQGVSVMFTAEGGPDYPPQWWEILPALP